MHKKLAKRKKYYSFHSFGYEKVNFPWTNLDFWPSRNSGRHFEPFFRVFNFWVQINIDGKGGVHENGSKNGNPGLVAQAEPLVIESSHMVEIRGSSDPVLIPFSSFSWGD